jgi:hypothetical protein
MTSVVKFISIFEEHLPYQLALSALWKDTLGSAPQMGPVTSTVDPADIRGLGTT